MPDMPWIDEYETHEWTVFTIQTDELPILTPLKATVRACSAESQMARDTYQRTCRISTVPEFFFFDLEQMAGNHNVFGVSDIGTLASEWRDYPAGSLVMVTYEGMNLTAPAESTYTCYVSRN